MELIYLLCSIVSTALTSAVLSPILHLRHLLRRFSGRREVSETDNSISVYQGTVWHERRHPVKHSFSYPVRYALFDLDSAAGLPPGHLSANDCRRTCGTTGPVLLLTIPESVGYEQNPLSLYYCYDVEGSTRHLRKCVAEVTNTPWGERVVFVFNPNSDLVAKPLHVSPFMDMQGNWSLKATDPGDSLHVVITVQHPSYGNFFTASLSAKRVNSLATKDHSMFFWLMPHKVALWIYWHALKLWWKKVPFVSHPRYENPTYREEAQIRDNNLQSCPSLRYDTANHIQAQENAQDTRTSNQRCFTWKDAKWPWC